MKSELALTRRTTYRAEENVGNLEKVKKKQDHDAYQTAEVEPIPYDVKVHAFAAIVLGKDHPFFAQGKKY